MVIKSLYQNEREILDAILHLHVEEGIQCDGTYGRGKFYDRPLFMKRPEHCFDTDPQHDYVTKADAKNLPLDDQSVSSYMLDPPFLTNVKGGRDYKDGQVIMAKKYGGYWSYDDLMEDYRGMVEEASRILKKRGHLIFKCQDIVHNHKLMCTHQKVIDIAEENSMRLKDLFILQAPTNRMPMPQKGVQRHARIWHSYFLVFLKG